ncbi:MAG: pentapeptide repeat-containing protein [Desulfovibrio sp.]
MEGEKICCKCVEHHWEDEPPMEVVFFDKAEEKGYCVFHAPKDEKRNALGSVVRYTETEFNNRVFARINDVIKLVKGGKAAKCTLSGTVFPGAIGFYGYNNSKSLPDIDLSRATFWGEVTFFRTTFSGEANFNKATFNNGARLAFSTFGGQADFRNATSKSDGSVQMLEIEARSLENLTFVRPQLPIFTFLSCRWPQALGLEQFGTGLAPSDDPKSYRACEELYRAMKQRAAEEHDQPQVSRWHFREKLMKLKLLLNNERSNNLIEVFEDQNAKWPARAWAWLKLLALPPYWPKRSLLGLYWAFSGFGEREIRAVVWLVALLLLPFLMHSPAGEWLSSMLSSAWVTIPYSANIDTFAASVRDSVNATAAVGFIPFMKETNGTSDGLRLGQALWQGVILLQFSLFALAVRNRFRR